MLVFVILSLVSSANSLLICEVGIQINEEPDNFQIQICKRWENTCQTKWITHDDGRTTVEKRCKSAKACASNTDGNPTNCWSESNLGLKNRHCYACCQYDRCNDFNFIPSPNGFVSVFQYRFQNDESFDRDWVDYKNGFGNFPTGEFWKGLDHLYQLTNYYTCRLRIDIQWFDLSVEWGEWESFVVQDEDSFYHLTVGNFTGTITDGASFLTDVPFSARDMDNDWSGANCALDEDGGWWFDDNCQVPESLNGDIRSFGMRKTKMSAICVPLEDTSPVTPIY